MAGRSILTIVLLAMVIASGYGQSPGYKGKKAGFIFGADIMPNPGLVNNMRYKEERNTPKGVPIPVSPALGLEYTFGLHITGGIKAAYAKNFVGYRVPWAIAGESGGTYSYAPDIYPIRIIDRNRYVQTLYSGIQIKYFFSKYLAPAGNYFQVELGEFFVFHDKNDQFHFRTKKETSGPEIETKIEAFDHYVDAPDKIGPFPYLGFSYHTRNEVGKVDGLFLDLGVELGYVIKNNIDASIQPFRLAKDISFESETLDEIITGTTYAYIAKQNHIKLNLTLIYLL